MCKKQTENNLTHKNFHKLKNEAYYKQSETTPMNIILIHSQERKKNCKKKAKSIIYYYRNKKTRQTQMHVKFKNHLLNQKLVSFIMLNFTRQRTHICTAIFWYLSERGNGTLLMTGKQQ